MINAEVEPDMLEHGQAPIIISFSGSPSILKGWIKSQLVFSFKVHVADYLPFIS